MENTIKNQKLANTFKLMKFTFVVLPIVAGADKFTNMLTNWEQYINPLILDILPFSATTFMIIVGVIEIGAGVIVWMKPQIGGYIVAAWLVGIGCQLLLSFNYLDVAVRDIVMAISAFSMARISQFAD